MHSRGTCPATLEDAVKTIGGHVVYTTLSEIADPAHTALLVVDMQNDYVSPGGASDRARRTDSDVFRDVILRTKGVVEAAREAGALVVYIQNTWLPGHKSVSGSWLRFMEKSGFPEGGAVTLEGAWGHKIVDELAPDAHDIVVRKWRASAFVGTNLDLVLRSNHIESVVICGVVTHGCVEST
ncbi:MAG: isochorismatase family cysteine hydrolase, partial [Chloroflexota bacterium]